MSELHPAPVKPLQCPAITGLETQTIVIAAGYGLWLVSGQSFGVNSAFRYARTVDEWMWCATLWMGVFLYCGGVVLWRCWVRQLGLVTIGLVWLAMSLCILAVTARLPGVWTFWVLSATAMYSAIRLFL